MNAISKSQHKITINYIAQLARDVENTNCTYAEE